MMLRVKLKGSNWSGMVMLIVEARSRDDGRLKGFEEDAFEVL